MYDDALKEAPSAFYARVSSDEQAQAQTIGTQTEAWERAIAHFGLNAVAVYTDDGVSGELESTERKGSAELLADASDGRFRVLYVWRVDRLGRNARDILNTEHQLAAYGVTMRSITEPFDIATPFGRYIFNALANNAGLEKSIIAGRFAAGKHRWARAGAWTGGIAPFGYRIVQNASRTYIEPSEQPIPNCPANMSEAESVRMIYRMLAESQSSCAQIALRLTAMGIPKATLIPGRNGGQVPRKTNPEWQPTDVRNIVNNPTYKGQHVYNRRSGAKKLVIKPREEHIYRECPALVDESVWDAACEQLARNRINADRNARRQYLLRGLIRCECGSGFTGRAGNRSASYECTSKHRARFSGEPPCHSKSIMAAWLESSIWNQITGWVHNPGDALDEVQERDNSTEIAEQLRDGIQKLNASLESKNGERDSVLALFRRGRINETALDRQLDSIDDEEKKIRTEIEQCKKQQRQLENTQARTEQVRQTLDSLRDLIETKHNGEDLSFAEIRGVVESLVIRIDVRRATIEDSNQHLTIQYAFTTATLTPPKNHIRKTYH